jgi:1A family penicillin-binding protein
VPFRLRCRGIIILALATFVVLGTVVLYRDLTADLPWPTGLKARAPMEATKFYDRDGRLLYEISQPEAGKGTEVALSEVPLALQQATVATEDASFYQHPGVNPLAIARALLTGLVEGEIRSGGSTITQQLARNLLLSSEERTQRTLNRKLREAVLALRLDGSYSKEEVLELYLNTTYYGNFAYGVEAAAQAYFGKPVRELSLAECALLAGLPQAPTTYNPLTSLEAALERRSVVLDLMVRNGYLSQEEAAQAGGETLRLVAQQFPIRAPHFVTYVWALLEERYGREAVTEGGLRVYTSLDLDMQEAAERIARRHLALLADRHRNSGIPDRKVRNASLVALDPSTGEILAMLGSPDYFDAESSGAVNGALALRQPGSTIKPVTYAAALELGYTPATVVWDVRTSFLTREGQPYVPQNYDRVFHGPASIRQALARSYNVVAVKVLDSIGLPAMTEMARRLGITTLNDLNRFGLAITLGGGEVSLLELTSAYATFASQGLRREPVAILRVEDTKGDYLYSWRQEPPRRALSPHVAYLITHILADNTARMAAFGENSVLKLSRPAAAKTGTTTDWRDNWTVGYTPDLVVGVWTGNADNEPMGRVSGVTGAGPIWHDFMEEAQKTGPAKEFQEPHGMVWAEVCPLSGERPSDLCPHRRRELFIEGTVPRATCTVHRAFRVDAPESYSDAEDSLRHEPVERVYAVLPAEAQDWARKMGIPQPPTEIGDPDTYDRGDSDGLAGPAQEMAMARDREALVITSPDTNSVFAIASDLPRSAQRIEVAARAGEAAVIREVTLYVDEQPLGTWNNPPYRAMWQLSGGGHAIRAVARDLEGHRWESPPIQITVVEE